MKEQGTQIIEGFSKLGRREREELIVQSFGLDTSWLEVLASFRHPEGDQQKKMESFSENTLSNYHLPLGVAPNFLINGRMYALPMLTEESSVVAAAANAAKYWARRGGFHTRVSGTRKTGQVHFLYKGDGEQLKKYWPRIRSAIEEALLPVTLSMQQRGGGVREINLIDLNRQMPAYYQVDMAFETADAMGANFINTCLETAAGAMQQYFSEQLPEDELQIIMSILSNYTPGCLAEATISCRIDQLSPAPGGLEPLVFASKFKTATDIAHIDVKRAVTHNKGIMNGVDALVLATGNDFRAVEANAQAFAAREGKYSALTECSLEEGIFSLTLRLPLAMGTVGGLTSLHPLAAFSLELLGKPSAANLMQITAAAGLASNFAAIASLVSTGIQKGHMKLHLENILNALSASKQEKKIITHHFARRTVSVTEVKKLLTEIRNRQHD